MKTDLFWGASFLLGFLFAFAVLQTTPGVGIFLGVNILVACLWYFGQKNVKAKELAADSRSQLLLYILTGFYVLLTVPYLYRLDLVIVGLLVFFHVSFLVVGALYFSFPGALKLVDILGVFLSPLIFGVTWFIESIKSFFELFKENGNVVRLVLKVILYSAASLIIFILFAKLLSVADSEFKTRIEAILEMLDLIEVMQRTAVAVVMSFVSAGLLSLVGYSKVLHFIGITTVEKAEEIGKKLDSPQEGRKSDALLPVIITVPVLLLFGFYVWVQFEYLFGQDVTSILTKYSFSDYARRGFIELLVVGGLTYPLLAWSMSQSKSNWIMTRVTSLVVNTGIVGAMLVMLYSLIMRLNLYMGAYGPSVLRYYVVIAAVFIAIALLSYEAFAIFKAIKPNGALFRGRLFSDYVVVALLVSLGLLGTIAVYPWNARVMSKITENYERNSKIDIAQVIEMPLEVEDKVFILGKTLEADGNKEAGLLLQAHAVKEIASYKESTQESIFSRLFGTNLTGITLSKSVNVSQKEELAKRFVNTMNERISFVANGYIDAIVRNDFTAARAFYDKNMQANDITGFAQNVWVNRKEDSQMTFDMVRNDMFVENFLSGVTSTSSYNLLLVSRKQDNATVSVDETSLSLVFAFRDAQIAITDSTLILAYLPDAISADGYNYDMSRYGYRQFCKIPSLDVIFSENMGCNSQDVNGSYYETKPTDNGYYQPMGSFIKSDFVTEAK